MAPGSGAGGDIGSHATQASVISAPVTVVDVTTMTIVYYTKV